MGSNYKSTLRLPQCDFAMRANLTHKEPKFLDYWKKIGLWKKLRAQSAGKEKFTLHDGPPYANGHIHIGTAMNKLLKDTINRFQQMSGKDACYVPGWDCHGLPIEWVIEKAMKAQGQNHEDLPITEFRNRCRKFAEQWVATQSQEFQRLGVSGDWENPYTTMKKASEKRILELLYSFLNDGSLYRSRKIVLWSVVEKTSLADAEVNYANLVSKAAYFLFPVKLLNQQPVDDLAVAVWTTTAWTIPCNQALAYNQQYTYGIYQAETDKLACRKLILADGCAARFTAHTGVKVKRLAAVDPSNLICKHPLHEAGYNDHVSLYQADFVTDATGTGVVHIAPDHGKDDYDVSVAHNFPVKVVVQEDGHYVSHLPLFAGQHIFKVKDQVHQALTAARMLVGLHDFTHESAISDRSKMPLIYRSTWQWFISMEKSNLQQKTLDQIEQITYHPQVSKNRLRSTLATRPDWLVSRQRRWGVPLAFFLNKKDLQPLRDQEVNARIIDAVAKEGSDTWFTSESSRFLGEKYAASDFLKVEDIIDIWFEAGATFSFVLEEDARLKFPADLYLEGSDQHRGWFQAALMLACGTRGVSPFKHLFTHGFVLDANGFKMSKSLGNTIAPQTIIDRYGADILRLWAVSIDYHDNMCIGDQLLEQTADCYRKFRNVLRFILGNLRHEGAQTVAQIKNLPKLESYVLHKLSLLEMEITGHIQKFEIREITQKLLKFCDLDLSAFYLNIRKDVLYCEAVDSQPREAANAVLHQLFQRLVRLLAPVLPFTAEEAWLSYHQENETSVHLQQIEAYCPAWQLPQHEIAAWNRLLSWTKLINEALEQARQNHLIRNNRETQVTLYPAEKEDLDLNLLAEINMVAEVTCKPSTETGTEDRVEVARLVGKECARCRKLVSKTDGQGDLCRRCTAVVGA